MDCRSTFFRLAQDVTSQACKGELHIGMWPPICWCILVESKAGFLFIFCLFQIKWFFECVSLKFSTRQQQLEVLNVDASCRD